jgi:predicted RNA-binding Zn-ribbon protein involved in translation (DUF1610 family)
MGKSSMSEMMGKCGHRLDYSEKYDSYFCPVCNIWTEKKCSDENCVFCKDKPDKPLMKKQGG